MARRLGSAMMANVDSTTDIYPGVYIPVKVYYANQCSFEARGFEIEFNQEKTIAAAAVAAQSLLISAFYVYYGDRSPLPYSVAMAIMAAFISYGRFALAPL
jgi:heptaprenylglyceryl phosphate synthase